MRAVAIGPVVRRVPPTHADAAGQRGARRIRDGRRRPRDRRRAARVVVLPVRGAPLPPEVVSARAVERVDPTDV
ncbi:hypothetical protein, partial [Burkholderia thailandensis]|uniref:hypothetical protein n=1 Tax=Burkholderia thailandensis TaxID=57975 RepID=UPI0028777041